GGSQAGISGWGTLGSPILYFFVLTFSSDPGAFGILQRQLQLAGQRIHGRSGALPHTLALEPHVADPASPRRNHTANGAVIGAIRVLLIEAPHDIGCDTNKRTQRSGRFDAVF